MPQFDFMTFVPLVFWTSFTMVMFLITHTHYIILPFTEYNKTFQKIKLQMERNSQDLLLPFLIFNFFFKFKTYNLLKIYSRKNLKKKKITFK